MYLSRYILGKETASTEGAAMPKVKILVWGYRCERCQHEWVPRAEEEPRVCPKCKSPYWNKPRKTNEKPQTPSKSQLKMAE